MAKKSNQAKQKAAKQPNQLREKQEGFGDKKLEGPNQPAT